MAASEATGSLARGDDMADEWASVSPSDKADMFNDEVTLARVSSLPTALTRTIRRARTRGDRLRGEADVRRAARQVGGRLERRRHRLRGGDGRLRANSDRLDGANTGRGHTVHGDKAAD